jgi:hypothetical protein
MRAPSLDEIGRLLDLAGLLRQLAFARQGKQFRCAGRARWFSCA